MAKQSNDGKGKYNKQCHLLWCFAPRRITGDKIEQHDVQILIGTKKIHAIRDIENYATKKEVIADL